MINVAIIDYGAGNLLSVSQALRHLNVNAFITNDPDDIHSADALVVPGVGAFPKAIDAIKNLGLCYPIKSAVQTGTPILGICLGLHIFFDESEEFEITQGLGLLKGRVVALPSRSIKGKALKLPYIGWAQLETYNCRQKFYRDELDQSFVYFLHSYMICSTEENIIQSHYTFGGHKITAIVQKNNITGVQFHPEKSGIIGLKFLEHWIKNARK